MSASSPQFDGEKQGAQMRLVLPRRAMQGSTGNLSGTRSGVSLDFSDYREYHPGDDLRNLDWNVFARSDKLTVKLFHEEVAPRVDLVIDRSGSMDLANSRKADAAAWLAAMLWCASRNAECRVRTWMLGDRLDPLPGGSRPPAEWEPWTCEGGNDPGRALMAAGHPWPRNGIRILVSDFLWQTDANQLVRRLADGAAGLILIRVLARVDRDAPPRGRWRLSDREGGEPVDLFVDAAVQERYRRALTSHTRVWKEACQQVNATFETLIAEDLLDAQRAYALERNGTVEPV